ncbi:hypothetical protein CJJ23_03555 [Mycoplasmopsis agassizii]|uniref:Uncharacterized protein n=1 Tax=Mycoplasmopsis agassizii TaxID=33922 RepID=A0A269TI42_9BACT|nr:hypothetical protein [Mycoplasmopsis agassizii]PAK21114.1 hypothetical protein CJJ23_03555 [Mycoplasmopsis agassizii]
MDINYILTKFKKKIESLDPIDKNFLISKGNKNGFEELVELQRKLKMKLIMNMFSILKLTHHIIFQILIYM